MLWQGQEFGENYFLPDFGAGRVALLRPLPLGLLLRRRRAGRLVRWSESCCAYDASRPQMRTGRYFFFNDWDRYQSRGVLLFARYAGAQYTLVALNIGDAEQTVPFWFPDRRRLRRGTARRRARSERRCRAAGDAADDPVALRPHLDGPHALGGECRHRLSTPHTLARQRPRWCASRIGIGEPSPAIRLRSVSRFGSTRFVSPSTWEYGPPDIRRRGTTAFEVPVTARMVRATRSGSSIMGTWLTSGSIVNVA